MGEAVGPAPRLQGAPQSGLPRLQAPGHPSPRLWEPLGRSDLAPEIAQTPPFLPAPPVGPPPRDPGQTTASGVRPLPYCTTAGGQTARIGVPGTGWGLQTTRLRAELTCQRLARSSPAESASRPRGPGETGGGSPQDQSRHRRMPVASAPRTALLRELRNQGVGS